MPTLQILGREAIEDQNNQANQALEQQKMVQSAMEKMMQFKQMAEQLKLMAKNTDNDVEKIKVQRLGDRMTYLSNVMKMAQDNPNPESVIKTALQLGGKDIMNDMSDPLVANMIKSLQPSGETAQKQAVANLINSKNPTAAPALTGADQGNFSGAPNQPAVNALSGAPQGMVSNMDTGFDVSAINAGGVQLEDYGTQARGAALSTTAQMQAKKLEGETVGESTAKDWGNKLNIATDTSATVNTLLDNPSFRASMGSFGGVKRAFAPYSKEGSLYLGFQAKAMDILNGYRTMVTGAQASEKELKEFIGIVIGRPENDTYETFLVKNLVGAATAIGKMNSDIQVYRGYDTTALKEALPALMTNLSVTIQAVKDRTGMDVDKVIAKFDLPPTLEAITQIMTRTALAGKPVSYEVAKRVLAQERR